MSAPSSSSTGAAPIVLDRLTPAAEHGWHILFDLTDADSENWLLIGGQMVYLLAIENGAQPIRATDDLDVVVDVRSKQGGTAWLADWLVDQGFELESVSADNIGHRFVRDAEPGPGRVAFDILAPEGIGERATLFTRKPARTVSAPGTSQAFARSELVAVTVSGDTGRGPRTGRVRRPSVLAALIVKAAATTISVRTNRERDWEDAALLLSVLADPFGAQEECSKGDRKRLRLLGQLNDTQHPAWRGLRTQAAVRGRDALGFLLG
jgi:hypothetical protein